MKVRWANVFIAIILLMTISLFWNKRVIIKSYKVEYIQPTHVYNTYKVTYMKVISNSSVKSYMSYKAITSKSSNQYRYIKKYMSVNEKGLLVDSEGYIGVALGSAFGSIGSKFVFTLDTGIVLKVVKVEAKSDKHTYKGFYHRVDTSVIEFVVDTQKAGKYYGIGGNGLVVDGNFNNINEFKGKIESIEVIK